MLKNGCQCCVTIGFGSSARNVRFRSIVTPALSSASRKHSSRSRLGRDKQQIVVFAADPFEVEAPNPLPVPVKAEPEPMVSKFHERRTKAALFEEFQCPGLNSNCS